MVSSSQSHSPALALETTMIQNALAGDACFVFQMGSSEQALESFTEAVEARFSECNFRLEGSATARGTATLGDFSVALSKLDPSRVTVSEGLKIPAGWVTVGDIPRFSIRLVTSTGEKLIDAKTERIESDQSPQVERHKTSELNIRVRDEKSAAKIADAFRRAIMLCGGGNPVPSSGTTPKTAR